METYIVYEGASLIDGKPIVALAQLGTRNRKTGDMVQTFILRSDVEPIEASRTGADESICGACPLKGTPHDGNTGQARGRSCYVTLMHAPRSKYRAYKAGRYPYAPNLAWVGRHRFVRIGTYGDGMAVPQYVWDELCKGALGHTAYTHQINKKPEMFMTSVEGLPAAQEAWARGERTFRVVKSEAEIDRSEVLCPASLEAGARVQCRDCLLCSGTSRTGRSVAIVAHGTSKGMLVRNLDNLGTTHDQRQHIFDTSISG